MVFTTPPMSRVTFGPGRRDCPHGALLPNTVGRPRFDQFQFVCPGFLWIEHRRSHLKSGITLQQWISSDSIGLARRGAEIVIVTRSLGLPRNGNRGEKT